MRGKGEEMCAPRDKGLPQDRRMAAYNGEGGRSRDRMRCSILIGHINSADSWTLVVSLRRRK